MISEVRGGTCDLCGRPLVQTSIRTYHPASVGPLSIDDCAGLIPLGVPGMYSADVPAAMFVPNRAPQDYEPA